MSKGFVTIATGRREYYKAAKQLLDSYKLNTKEPLPFAILCDKENEYTKFFDKVIILKKPNYSYMDKIELLNNINLPYDETVFVESDCLAYADLNLYFSAFSNADDFSVFGRALALDSLENGWFKLSETGKYRERIKFIPRFHSVVLFLRKSDKLSMMYEICQEVAKNYSEYNIGGNKEGLDDKLFAISSAIVGCKPISTGVGEYNAYQYPTILTARDKPKANMIKRELTFIDIKKKRKKAIIAHFANLNLKKVLYKREYSVVKSLLKKHKFGAKVKRFFWNMLIPFSWLHEYAKNKFYEFMDSKFYKKLRNLLKRSTKE